MADGPGFVQIALRVSPDLRERIKSAAENNGRSVNTELVVTLEGHYPAPMPFEAVKRLLDTLEAQVLADREKLADQDRLSDSEMEEFERKRTEIDALLSDLRKQITAMNPSTAPRS